MPVIAAVEIVGDGPGRVRLAPIAGYSAESIGGFVATNVASGATLKTDGWAAYPGTSAVDHDRHVVGKMAAHLVLPWTHRVFALHEVGAKRQPQALGVGRLPWPPAQPSPILPR